MTLSDRIVCTAYMGGLEAKHFVTTCLARIAAGEHVCLTKCDQAAGLRKTYKKELTALKAARALNAHKIKNKIAKMSLSANFLKDENEMIRQKSFQDYEQAQKKRKNKLEQTAITSLKAATQSPECPKHPGQPQKQDHRGRYMGQCLLCMREKQKKIVKTRIVEPPSEPEITGTHLPELGNNFPPGPMRYCPTPGHKDRPQYTMLRLGKRIWGGLCEECKSIRAHAGGAKRKENMVATQAINVTVNFGKTKVDQDLLKYLKESAAKNRRVLQEEILFRLEKSLAAETLVPVSIHTV